MKDFCDLARVRRSIRKFQDKAVETDKLKGILKAVLMAPSSKRSQPWQFVVVDEKEKLAALSICREMGCKFLAEAPMAVVILADVAVRQYTSTHFQALLPTQSCTLQTVRF